MGSLSSHTPKKHGNRRAYPEEYVGDGDDFAVQNGWLVEIRLHELDDLRERVGHLLHVAGKQVRLGAVSVRTVAAGSLAESW